MVALVVITTMKGLHSSRLRGPAGGAGAGAGAGARVDGTIDRAHEVVSPTGTESAVDASTPTTTSEPGRTLSRISTAEVRPYRLYKRRFFGLGVLMLLNVVVSWDWISFAPVSKTSAQYFGTKESTINWLSTAYLFAYCVAGPGTYYALNRHGPKGSILAAAGLLLAGNWIRYGGAHANRFAVVMFGQILLGLAQPFVLSAPTCYSDLWFSTTGRTTATALASLSNPFGAALGQLINPFWVSHPHDVPAMTLYVAAIASVAALPALFIADRPPTPPTAGASAIAANRRTASAARDARVLLTSLEFYLVFIPFGVYVGFFNAFSSLLNQILEPYGYSENEAGIAGAILIVVGLVSAAISSPLMDRYKFYVPYFRAATPLIAICYLIFIWAPPAPTIACAYVICAVLGAASFGLVPVALEFLVEVHHPLGPEMSSTLCWSAGQLLGGVFIIVMNALKAGPDAHPPATMKKALIFEAVVSLLVMPMPLVLGLFGRKQHVISKRTQVDLSSRTQPLSDGAEVEAVNSFDSAARMLP